MADSRASAPRHQAKAVIAGVLLAGLLLVLTLAAPALAARSGRVGPEVRPMWEPGKVSALAVRGAAGDAWVRHGIWDAQPTGTLVYTMQDVAPWMTLTSTDATGRTVWSMASGDISAASGALPAAFIAAFPDPDPNVLRSGDLTAKNADGTTRFRKTFKNKFVQPLCDSPARLVWVEVSAKAVTRVFVRQGSTTRSIAMPYAPPRAAFTNPAASSADGSRLIVGASMRSTSKRRVMTYWLHVSRSGVPSIVSHGVTDWVSASLTPSGDKAAILTSDGLGDGPNWWVSFGKFRGGMIPGNDAGMLDAGEQLIFEQGAYYYGDGDTTSWGATTVEVFDRSLMAMYKRTWTFDDASSSLWFRHDGRIDRLAGVDNKGALTVINVNSWAITTVPGTYTDAVPIDGGRLATMTPDGTLVFIPDPVPGP
jgi:hypothetical protein